MCRPARHSGRRYSHRGGQASKGRRVSIGSVRANLRGGYSRPVTSSGWSAEPLPELANDRVLLRRVREADRAELGAIALDPDIWRHFIVRVDSAADFDAFFDRMLAEDAAGTRVVYLVVEKPTGRIAGSMSYCNLSPKDLRLEIGSSWLGADFRGTGLNRQAKLLLMRQAFDRLGAERVEFKTDVLNLRARQGLLNIGAVAEGVLRSYNPMPDGRRRDAIFFSVIRADWPETERRLLAG